MFQLMQSSMRPVDRQMLLYSSKIRPNSLLVMSNWSVKEESNCRVVRSRGSLLPERWSGNLRFYFLMRLRVLWTPTQSIKYNKLWMLSLKTQRATRPWSSLLTDSPLSRMLTKSWSWREAILQKGVHIKSSLTKTAFTDNWSKDSSCPLSKIEARNNQRLKLIRKYK